MRAGARFTIIGFGLLPAFVMLAAEIPVFAAEVAIVQGSDITSGTRGRQVLVPPGAGYTIAIAISSNPRIVQTGTVDLATGAWGVNYSVAGLGIAVVTVAWRNPTTSNVRRQYFVVAAGAIVNDASTLALAIGDTMTVPARNPLTAEVYSGDIASSSQAVAAVVHEDGVQVTGQDKGTCFVYTKLPADQSGAYHYVVTIVTVLPPGEPPIVD